MYVSLTMLSMVLSEGCTTVWYASEMCPQFPLVHLGILKTDALRVATDKNDRAHNP